jgi:hypothetical protein
MPNKVFVSHASEDKERFVLDLATRLRERGIDAWLDKWEMAAGDSLVDKIFEEGLKDATAVIIVVSENSIAKPWVREELNATIVQRISKGTKVIPIVIDDCEVPMALTSTLYVKVHDTGAYDDEFERIVASILGLSDKPPLGDLPAYASSPIASIGGLTQVDSVVLRLACEEAIEVGDMFISTTPVFAKATEKGLPPSELQDSLEILGDQGYLRLNKTLSGRPNQFWVTDYGFETYALACVPDYAAKVHQVISALVNDNLASNVAVVTSTGLPRLLVNHVFNMLSNASLITKSSSHGSMTHVVDKSPALRRRLANG